MEDSAAKKNPHMHVKCVVCGNMFSSEFDEITRGYRCFHPELYQNKHHECEFLFYSALLEIYRYLHLSESSVPMSFIIRDIIWKTAIDMKKEMIQWSLTSGYLGIDSLKRIMIPKPLEDVCAEIFTTYNLDAEQSRSRAVEYIIAALRCMNKDLIHVSEEDLTEDQTAPPPGQEPSLIEKQPSGASGMATAERTGARRGTKRG